MFCSILPIDQRTPAFANPALQSLDILPELLQFVLQVNATLLHSHMHTEKKPDKTPTSGLYITAHKASENEAGFHADSRRATKNLALQS